jgi:hypothetical protein
MILLITSLTKAQDCAKAIQEALSEPVVVAASLHEAAALLQSQEVSAAVFDQLLLDVEPDDGDAAFRNLGTAFPIYMNLAVTGIDRMKRELRSALQRRKREVFAARREAEHALRNELKDKITVLLVSCEMALQEADLPVAAQTKLSGVYEIAKQLREQLEAGAKGATSGG